MFFFSLWEPSVIALALYLSLFLCLSVSFHCCSFLSFRDLRKTELTEIRFSLGGWETELSSCAMTSRMFLYVPSVCMCRCTLTHQTIIIPSSSDIAVWCQPFANSKVRPWCQRKMHNVLMNLLYEAISVSLGRLEQNVLYKWIKCRWMETGTHRELSWMPELVSHWNQASSVSSWI